MALLSGLKPQEVVAMVGVAVAAYFGLFYGLRVIYSFLFSPLRRVNGPFWARVSRLWELRRVLKGGSHEEFVQWHEKYGPVVRVAPNRYSFSRPEDVRTIYQIGGDFVKSEYYAPLLSPVREQQNVFVIRDNQYHKERRRKVSALYSMSTIVSYEEAVNKMTAVCIDKLRDFSRQKRLLSIPSFMQYYAFDVIGEITFNKSFGMMDAETDTTGMIPGIHKSITDLAYFGLVPKFHPWYASVSWIWGDDMSSVMRLVGYTLSEIGRHRKENEQKSKDTKYDTFLKKLLDLEAAHKVDTSNMIDAAGSNIAAGSDTTAISLSAALYYLYKNPRVLAKLRDEIDTLAAEGKVSDPVTFAEAQSMPYLQAVIKESLRMHPAVGTILPRKVPKGGAKLAGINFPEGTHVGANAWVLHYSKEIYGEDAHTYRPERWFDVKSSGDDRNTMMFAFGGGSRTCLGKNISLLEINKVIPQIVRNIDLVFEDGKPWKTKSAWFVFPQFEARLALREQPQTSG